MQISAKGKRTFEEIGSRLEAQHGRVDLDRPWLGQLVGHVLGFKNISTVPGTANR
jgi:hypothetical protein